MVRTYLTHYVIASIPNSFLIRHPIQSNPPQNNMGFSKTNWFSKVRYKLNFHKSSSSPRDKTITLQANCEETFVTEEENETSSTPEKKVLSREDVAAIKIQALFRAHLARQAFRALRSLVKLQALVRGVSVRKQSRIALHCMHALVRLQVRVRARQLLGIQN